MRAVSVAAIAQSQRLLAFVGLSIGEIFLSSFFFNFPTALPDLANPVLYVKVFAQSASLAVLIFFLIVGQKRSRIVQAWSQVARRDNWLAGVLTNLVLFGLLLAATVSLSNLAASSAQPPWPWFALYCCLLLAAALSLGAVAAPCRFWKWLWSVASTEIGVAFMVGVLLVLAGRLSLEGWATMSSATLRGSHWILTLYETDTVLDTQRQILGVGDFRVMVLKECSGYEGIGLVATFLGLYCWLMRRQLRFPHALVLIPVSISAVWILNLFRIAALVSVGRHISADIAVDGFHSQAGWIGFLLVSVGAMAASQKAEFLRRPPPTAAVPAKQSDDRVLLAFLMPFIALTGASVLASLFAPQDQCFYFLKVVAVAAAVWYFRDVYLRLPLAVSPFSIMVGAAIAAVWIATESKAETVPPLGAWLAAQPAWLLVSWMVCRALGGVLLVPLAEELAFRGYLQRVFIARDFLAVPPGKFTWLSYVGTSVLFGLMHQRWVVATFASTLYSLLVYRSNRLSDPIAAHATSNAVIIIWAIVTDQWSLL